MTSRQGLNFGNDSPRGDSVRCRGTETPDGGPCSSGRPVRLQRWNRWDNGTQLGKSWGRGGGELGMKRAEVGGASGKDGGPCKVGMGLGHGQKDLEKRRETGGVSGDGGGAQG